MPMQIQPLFPLSYLGLPKSLIPIITPTSNPGYKTLLPRRAKRHSEQLWEENHQPTSITKSD